MATPWPEHSSATSKGSSTRSKGMPGVRELVGRDGGGAEPLRQRPPGRVRLADDDVGDATRSGGGDAQRADRARARSRAPAGPPRRRRASKPCSATASGSASAAARIDSAGRDAQELGVARLARSRRTRLGNRRRRGWPRPVQSCGRPARQYSHSPQRCAGPPTTSSPGDHPVTSSPTATTRPSTRARRWSSARPTRRRTCAGRCRRPRSD